MAIPACASLDRMCFSALAICKVAVKEAMVFLSIFMLLVRLLVGGVCWWVVFAGGWCLLVVLLLCFAAGSISNVHHHLRFSHKPGKVKTSTAFQPNSLVLHHASQ